MSTIKLNYGQIDNIAQDMKRTMNQSKTIQNNVSSSTSRVSGEIKLRRNIASQLSAINSDLTALHARLSKIQKFVQQSADAYEKTEKKVERDGEKVAENITKFVGAKESNLNDQLKIIGQLSSAVSGLFFSEFKLHNIGTFKVKFDGKGLKLEFSQKGYVGTDYEKYTNVRNTIDKKSGVIIKKKELDKLLSGVPLYGRLKDAEGKRTVRTKDQQTLFKLLENGITEGDLKRSNFKKNSEKLLDTAKNKAHDMRNMARKTVGQDEVKRKPKKEKPEKKVVEKYLEQNRKSGFLSLQTVDKFLKPVTLGLDAWSNAKDAAKEKTREDKAYRFIGGMGVDLGTGWASTFAGAKVGAFAGSAFFPPIGTVIGGVVGGAGGAFIGDRFMNWKHNGEKVSDILKDKATKAVKNVADKSKEAAKSIGKAGKNAWKTVTNWFD